MWSRCRKSAVEVMPDKLQKFCVISLTQGGRHADNSIDLQEFMIMPVGAVCFEEGLQMCAEIYKMLRAILEKYDYPTAVGDEGGFAPNLPDAKEALHMIMRAIEKAGYKPKEQIVIALDAAASELYDKERKEYVFPGEAKMHGHRVARSTEEMIDYYEELAGEFPIISIEDPLDEEDWEGWELLTTRLGLDMQLVGDERRHFKGDRQCNSDQGESDWDSDGSHRCDPDGAEGWLSGNCIPPVRRDRGSVYCRPCGGI